MKQVTAMFALAIFANLALATNFPGQIPNPGWPGETLSGNPCWGKKRAYGPYDYARTTPKNHRLVENFHFTPEVEALKGGKSGTIADDIDYTLRAFPNHYRALWAYTRYYLAAPETEEDRQRYEGVQRGYAPPECYFNRAIRALPKDGMVRMLFGVYLHKTERYEQALAEYQVAEKYLPEHGELTYNMGLLYLDLDQLDKAKEYEQRARQLGYPLRGLQRLIAQRSEGSVGEDAQ